MSAASGPAEIGTYGSDVKAPPRAGSRLDEIAKLLADALAEDVEPKPDDDAARSTR